MRLSRFIAGTLVPALLLTSCGKSASSNLTTRSAVHAPLLAYQLAGLYRPPNRPSASLGVFVSLFLSQGGSMPVASTLAGIAAAQLLMQPLNPDNLDDAYLLLQDFGSVLQVNVPDMLNQQTDRTGALNEYVTGLRNITIRAQLKAKEIHNASEARRDTLRTQQQTLSSVRNQIQKALHSQDYATAGALQPQANSAQVAVEKTQSEISRLNEVGRIFDQLLAIATERYGAIEQNRAPLLSGVKVVQVPGVEDLNLLLKGRSSTSTPFNTNLDTGGGGLNTDSLNDLKGPLF